MTSELAFTFNYLIVFVSLMIVAIMDTVFYPSPGSGRGCIGNRLIGHSLLSRTFDSTNYG